MKNVIVLVKKDIKRFFKDPAAVVMSFIAPAVLIIIFGNVFGGGGNGGRGKANIIFVNESASKAATLLEEKLDSSSTLNPIKTYTENDKKIKFTEEKAKEYVVDGKISTALVIPKNFISDTSNGINLKMFYDPKNEIESSMIQGSLQRTIMTQLPSLFPVILQKKANNILGNEKAENFRRDYAEVISEYFNVPVDSVLNSTMNTDPENISFNEGNDEGSNIMENLINFENVQLVGKEVENPYIARTVGGYAVMFLLFTMAATAMSFFEEKQEGSLKRLLCMPVTRSQILWSKYAYSMIIGIFQVAVLFIFAWAVFGLDISKNTLNLFIVIVFSTGAAVAFGMIIVAFTKSLNQASGVSTLIVLGMSAIGGSWFPIQFMPEWMQTISKLTITYWSVEAFLDVLWRLSPLTDILYHLVILSIIAVLVNALALYRFNKGNIF